MKDKKIISYFKLSQFIFWSQMLEHRAAEVHVSTRCVRRKVAFKQMIW